MARMSVPRWSVYVVVAALIASLSFSFGSLYSAFGTSHNTTYYACLYAGSLSQVGTTPPANCGRGSQISWNSEGVEGPVGPEGPSGTSQAYTVLLGGNDQLPDTGLATLRQFELPAGTYIVIVAAQIGVSADAEAVCRLVSGSQSTVDFVIHAEFDITLMQGAFVLDEPSNIEIRCALFAGTSGILSTVHVVAIQVDNLTEIEVAP
ncbi:MAG TPA: hypothetical protein VMM78_13940 [Thermomicrobiales bacterium]|nr:hypothetical protein [Thermomicrobiales bacterium]